MTVRTGHRSLIHAQISLFKGIKAGVYMKMSEKSDFLFSLKLASSTIGLHIGKNCFGVFSKLNAN